MEDDDENYDLIAPGTQNIERQDEDEGAQDLHPEFNENYDLSGDLGIPLAASNTEQLILHEEQDDVYRGMVQKLNKKKNFSTMYYTLLKLLIIHSTVFLVEEQELASHISLSVFIKQH